MKAVVTAPFSDVFGIPHNVGDTIDISEYGFKRYEGFVKEPEKKEAKKNGRKRKSDASSEAESTNQN